MSVTPDAAPRSERFVLQVAPRWSAMAPTVAQARALVGTPPLAVVHESARGVVFLVRCGPDVLVVKRSHLERASRWRRFMSLFRCADATRAFRNQERLHQLGLPVPEPVLALEHRRRGLVIDSWHVYRHSAGRVCNARDAPRIAQALAALHARGWVHGDPHVANFVWDGASVVILDCARARPRCSRYARAYDLALLEKCCRGLGHPAPALPADTPHRLARLHVRVLVAWRAAKRHLRARLRRPAPAADTPSGGA